MFFIDACHHCGWYHKTGSRNWANLAETRTILDSPTAPRRCLPLLNSSSAHRLYDANFLIALLCQTCFVAANTLMAHYARWIEFLGGDLGQVGMVMGAGITKACGFRAASQAWRGRMNDCALP